MDLWFSESHTPDVKLSVRTEEQLFVGKVSGKIFLSSIPHLLAKC